MFKVFLVYNFFFLRSFSPYSSSIVFVYTRVRQYCVDLQMRQTLVDQIVYGHVKMILAIRGLCKKKDLQIHHKYTQTQKEKERGRGGERERGHIAKNTLCPIISNTPNKSYSNLKQSTFTTCIGIFDCQTILNIHLHYISINYLIIQSALF